jgi:hypothetical protein
MNPDLPLLKERGAESSIVRKFFGVRFLLPNEPNDEVSDPSLPQCKLQGRCHEIPKLAK